MMGRHTLVVCAISLLVLLNVAAADPVLRIGSFNIENFGGRKLQDPMIRNALIQVVCPYDIMFIQEIRNKDTLVNFVNYLNTYTAQQITGECSGAYFYKAYSPLLPMLPGRLRKEMYAFLYRKGNVRLKAKIVPITGLHEEPIFARPPAVALVGPNPEIYWWKNHILPYFLLIGLHSKPHRAYSELHGLWSVYNKMRHKFKEAAGNALLLGDLNAACDYFGRTEQLQKTLVPSNGFKWLIHNNMPTNVAKKRCAYDRFIAVGYYMQRCATNAHVDGNFATVVGALNNGSAPRKVLRKVSDHYPISVDINCPQSLDADEWGVWSQKVSESGSFSVRS